MRPYVTRRPTPSAPGGRRRVLVATLVATSFLGACAAAGRPTASRPSVAPGAATPSRGSAGTVGIPPFAVADLPGDSILAPLSFALADLLSTDLARSRHITLVERARLGEVLRELDLASTGRIDSSTAPRVGRLLQAQRLVVGRVAATPTGTRTIRLGVQLEDVARGSVEQAVDASAPLADVLAAEKELAFRLFDALGVTLTPDERAAVEQKPTTNLAALVAYGRAVRQQLLGDYRGAADELRRAQRLDSRFRAARERAAEVRRVSESGVSNPVLVPGVRAVDAAVGATVDRLNRPLDIITTVTTGATSRTTDPTFPTATATVVITVSRP